MFHILEFVVVMSFLFKQGISELNKKRSNNNFTLNFSKSWLRVQNKTFPCLCKILLEEVIFLEH
jgi:hypothetical protein